MSRHKEKKIDLPVNAPDSQGTDEEPVEGVIEVNSIEDFIELKRLQNRILNKILENINPTEDQTKSKNK